MRKSFVIAAAILAALLILPLALGKRDRTYHVAILTPFSHPSIAQIERAFVESLGKKYRCKFFNAEGSRALMNEEVREIEQGGYDLVFTVGASATQATQQAFSRLKKKTPIVFAGVDHPEGLDLGKDITGVREYIDYHLQIDLLESIEPDAQNILLVYDPTGYGLEADRQTVEKILRKKGMSLISIAVSSGEEIMEKVPEQLFFADCVMVFKDNTVVSAIAELSELCRQRGISLVASDLGSADLGATYAIGVDEADFGREAGKKAIAILEGGMSPRDIPITPLIDYQLKAHKEVALDTEQFPHIKFRVS